MVEVTIQPGKLLTKEGAHRVRLGAHARSRLSVRRLQVALGLAWLLDGALQFQPYMYKPGANGFLGPVTQNAMGPPNLLTDFISTVVTFMVAHQVLATTGIGVVQLAIGAGLCWRRSARAALALSVVWALGVWVIGEAVGQLIFPQASMLTGSPGAALVYFLLGLVLWPRSRSRPDLVGPSSVADEGLLGGIGARAAWAVIWCGTSLLELERVNHAPNAISAQLANAAVGEPAPLAWLGRGAAQLTHGVGTEVALVLLLVELVVGWAILREPSRKFALGLGIVASVVFWVLGQDLGAILTGQGTDPNLGLPMLILALALWPRGGRTAGERALVSGVTGHIPTGHIRRE
ncbi:MAG: hypothetical protein ACRDY2_02255 [Acidimicrobiales bacterium]